MLMNENTLTREGEISVIFVRQQLQELFALNVQVFTANPIV